MEMEKEFLEIVKKNLPETTAGELRKFIDEANLAIAENKRLGKMVDEYMEQVKALQTANSTLVAEKTKFTSKLAEIEQREATISKREHDMDIAELKYKLAAVESSKQDIFRLAETVFRNPQLKTTGFLPVPVEGMPPSPSNSYGSTPFVGSGPVELTQETV